MKIGFIGLGNMGGPMAANLAKAGHAVTGFDLATTPPGGVTAADSAAAAATGADVVITMLPNGAILKSVAAEIIPAMSQGAVFLDCSTVDVASARDRRHCRSCGPTLTRASPGVPSSSVTVTGASPSRSSSSRTVPSRSGR